MDNLTKNSNEKELEKDSEKGYNGYYITTVAKTSERHRSRVIIHRPIIEYFAEFDSMEQLNNFATMLGFTYKLEETNGLYRRYSISHYIVDDRNCSFWDVEQLPSNVKPFRAHSNGMDVVTCYFLNDGEKITIFRPNPNAKKVYEPLELTEQRIHHQTNGSY